MQELYDAARGMTEAYRANKKATEDAKVRALFDSIRDKIPEIVTKAAQIGDTRATMYLGADYEEYVELYRTGELARLVAPFVMHPTGLYRFMISWNE